MSEKTEFDDDHVIPPRIPPELVARYSPDRDPDSERDIAHYVELEAHDETVQNVELIKREYVLGEHYDIWDVVTDKNRWWVFTNLTNLYSQADFPSLDYTFSFHIGLMARVRSRQEPSTDPSPFLELERRRDQAFEKYERAVEAEDFQAVGLMLRESLVTLITLVRDHLDFPKQTEMPKRADFNGQVDLVLNTVVPGESNKQLRHYLKAVSKETWQLVNWLTHDRNATSVSTSIALHSFDTMFGHLSQMLVRNRTGDLAACPACSSRDVRTHYDHTLEPQGDYYSTCGACGWSNHPSAGADGGAK